MFLLIMHKHISTADILASVKFDRFQMHFGRELLKYLQVQVFVSSRESRQNQMFVSGGHFTRYRCNFLSF